MDFNELNREVVFDSSSTNVSCYDLDILDDSIVESHEIFLLEVSSEDSAVLFPSPNVSITIEDNDGMLRQYLSQCTFHYCQRHLNFIMKLCYYAVLEVSFENPVYTIDEGTGILSVCLLLNTTLDRNVLLSVQTQSLTAQSTLKQSYK